MGKVQQNSNKKRSLRSQLTNGIVLGTFIGLFLLSPLLIFALQGEYMSFFSPAKKAAKIMPPFAEKNNLKKLSEYNNPAGIDNSTYSYSFTYQSDEPMEQVYKKIKDLLEKNGYMLLGKYISEPCINGHNFDCLNEEYNHNKPYWKFGGTGKPAIVRGTVTDQDYLDNEKLREYYQVEKNKTILNIEFSVENR